MPLFGKKKAINTVNHTPSQPLVSTDNGMMINGKSYYNKYNKKSKGKAVGTYVPARSEDYGLYPRGAASYFNVGKSSMTFEGSANQSTGPINQPNAIPINSVGDIPMSVSGMGGVPRPEHHIKNITSPAPYQTKGVQNRNRR
jgi:hypothetical protein